MALKLVPLFTIFASRLTIIPSEEVKCLNNYKCLPISDCLMDDLDGGFNYPCDKNHSLICCPPKSKIQLFNKTNLQVRKSSHFPTNCGVVLTDDKISGGVVADLGQFPWMVLLGYRQKFIDYTQFLCGGSIITEDFILTAAHCLGLDKSLELVVARLGEHDLSSEIDCVEIMETKICADRHVDIPIGQSIPHPNYDKIKLENDIALVKLKNKIKFTDYIKPICLPFGNKKFHQQKLIVSGWGKISAAKLGGSKTLQFTSVNMWNQSVCNKSVPPEVRPLHETQLCANGDKNEDACKGDSGGPLIDLSADNSNDLRYFQIGIVSFASSLTCGNPQLPTVYTRVDKYLKWIEDNIN